jgi:hypothetical protein
MSAFDTVSVSGRGNMHCFKRARFDRTMQHFNFRFLEILLFVESGNKSFLGLLIVGFLLKNFIATIGFLDSSCIMFFGGSLRIKYLSIRCMALYSMNRLMFERYFRHTIIWSCLLADFFSKNASPATYHCRTSSRILVLSQVGFHLFL